MILIRPAISGELTGGTPDGCPIPSGGHVSISWSTYGPAVTAEWFARETDGLQGMCTVIEFIWDRSPCADKPFGVSHQIIRAGKSGGESTAWTSVCKANPHRYAILFGAVTDRSSGPPQTTVTVQ